MIVERDQLKDDEWLSPKVMAPSFRTTVEHANKKTMHYLIIGIDHPGTADVRQHTESRHRDYVAEANSDVRVKIAGPLMTRDNRSMIGSMMVVEAESAEAAERFAAGDPYRKAGLFAEVTIRLWRCTTGAFGLNDGQPT